MRIRTKQEKNRELIAKAVESIEGKQQEEIIDEVSNYETQTILAREQLFEKLSPEEKIKPETREWFDKLDWTKFKEHFTALHTKKQEIKAYLETENFSAAQKVKFLTEELSRLKKEITKNEIGREILLHFKFEFYLQLFNPTPGLIVENDDGKEFDFSHKGIDQAGKQIAEYGAYEDILEEYAPIIPEDPHLRDVTKTEAHYHAIINILVEEEIIDKDSKKWIITKEYSKKFIGNLIRLLYYKDFYKEIELTDEKVQSIVKNTFAQTIGIRYSKGGDYSEPELKRIVRKVQDSLVS
ncbi:hypothetical protein [uncultured Draconibacterium sp.]|uniref:hypothetical protein n=1 Tax=uncultured Draconibacterium sp. TaxID=1573823 RepID=UPI00325FEFED